MARDKTSRKAANLKAALDEQGRSVAWLAREMGYSRGYVSNVLNGQTPFTPHFQSKAIEALKAKATIPQRFKGRVVQVPENIYQAAADLPLIVVESAYEEAWKRAWLDENAAVTLATAADRAWQAESVVTDLDAA